MNSQDFIENATKTESRVAAAALASADMRTFMNLLEASVQIAKSIDHFKRHIYYGKDLNRPGAVSAMRDATRLLRSGTLEAEGTMLRGTGAEQLGPAIPLLSDARVVHGLIGMFSECGELIEALLLAENARKPLDRVNVAEEIGDVEWYKAVLLDATGLSEETIRETVIAKLKKRYGDKFTSEAATNRDLAGERAVLEANIAAEAV